MAYLLRVFDSTDRLLITASCDTVEEAGRRRADFLLREIVVIHELGPASPTGPRVELVYRERDGEERPITNAEDATFLGAFDQRRVKLIEEGTPLCSRCGRGREEHQPNTPVFGAREGLVYFSCWTAEERELLPPGVNAS
jgi:hypothetical protein